MLPVFPSEGVGFDAPRKQKNPTAHKPVGCENPLKPQ